MEKFLLCFIPLFVAVDAIGIVPLFVNLTENIKPKKLTKIIYIACLTAFLVVASFIMWGNGFLRLINIQIHDFKIAGGILLFIISIREILSFEKKQRSIDPNDFGAVPIGIPLITGPAVLTTSIILVNKFGVLQTLFSATLNIIIAGVLFYFSRFLVKVFTRTGTHTISKVVSLVMAAYAIMLIRTGIEAFFLK